jgi:hypothetical protein
MGAIFPGLSTDEKINFPGTYATGKDMVTVLTNRLLFVPDDETNNPICLVQKASGAIVQPFYFRRNTDVNFECVFDCFRKTNNIDGIIYVGLLSGGVLR